MHKQLQSIFVGLILLVSAVSVSAQFETCGIPGLPACTPTPGPGQPADDRDGDGVADFVDGCPDQAGTGFTNGCPAGVATAAPPLGLTAPLVFPESGDCLIGSFSNVNVRAEPDINSAIVLVLTPGNFLWALYIVINGQGEAWYYTLVDGYVRTDVVQNNGNCDDLTVIRRLTLAGNLDSPPSDPAAMPPPDDHDCYYWIIYQGNVVCLLNEPVELGIPLPGTDNAPPPDDPFCEYQVIIDGNAICIIDDAVDLTAAGVPPANLPPVGDPTCYRLVINYETGQAYCLVTIPPVFTAGGDGSQDAPPPPDPTCYYWVVINGQAICLVTIEPNFAADLGDGEAQGFVPDGSVRFVMDGIHGADCGLYPATHPLYQDVMIPANVREAMGDPIPNEGCGFALLIQFPPSDMSAGGSAETHQLEELTYNFQPIRSPEDDPGDFMLLLPAQGDRPASAVLCTVPDQGRPMVCNTL